MIPYLKAIFMEEGAFIGAMRAFFMVGGIAAETGKLGLPEEYEFIGIFFIAAGMMMRSSVPPPKKED